MSAAIVPRRSLWRGMKALCSTACCSAIASMFAGES